MRPKGLYKVLFLAALLAFGLGRAALLVPRLGLSSPPPTPLFEDREGNFLSDGEAIYGSLGYWDLPDPLPEKVRATVIAIEDRRFETHPGVDSRGLVRAFIHGLSGKREGGSTIAMQVARLEFPRPRTLAAKLDEANLALLLTLFHGREKVLRHYLKLIPEGGNLYGISYAARRYFRKPVQDLSWAETSLLLAIPQDPSDRSLFRFEGFYTALARAEAILGQLNRIGILDASGLEASKAELAGIPPFYREERPENAYHFVFRVMDEYGMAAARSLKKPLRTSLDPGLQDLASGLAKAAIGRYRALGADNMAVLITDAQTGEVRAYVGSASYFDEANKGSIDYCRVQRSSGSTLKPFLYALGLETGAFGPASIIPDLPLRIQDGKGLYSLTDFDDSYLGPLLYRRALANSRNVPAIRVLQGIGLEEAYAFLARLGLHDQERGPDFYGYGLAVGGIYTSLDRIVRAYGILAREGKGFELRFLADSPPQADSVILSENSARMASLFLSDPEARLPSFASTALTNFPFPVAVKTGTSNGFRDAWALGYSRRYVAGIWIGHSGNREMNHVAGSTAAELLLELFKALQPGAVQGIDEEAFPPPRSWQAFRLCPDSGYLAGPHCPHPCLEYLPPGSEPRSTCPVHVVLMVDSRTGEEALPTTPASRLVARTVTLLPPEYAAFSKARGYATPRGDPAALRDARIDLVAPQDRLHLYIDPETPVRYQTLALRATVSPPVPEILWLVDGVEFAHVPYPYEARWPVQAGSHSFQARFPHAQVVSGKVTVTVTPPSP